MTASPWVRKSVIPPADFVESLTLEKGGSLRWIASLRSKDGVQPGRLKFYVAVPCRLLHA